MKVSGRSSRKIYIQIKVCCHLFIQQTFVDT